MRDWLRLVRAHNLLIAALGVCAGGWIGLARLALPAALVWASISGIGLGMAGNAVNDLLDVSTDAANRRLDRPLAARRLGRGTAAASAGAGILVGLGCAALAGPLVVLAGAGALVVMLLYSSMLKRVTLLGNLAVAVAAGLPLMYGALAVDRPAAGLVPWMLAAALHLVRELVKDIRDIEGDRLTGRRTLAVAVGRRPAAATAGLAALGFIPLSLWLPVRAGYGGAYFVLALPAQMAVLIAAARLLLGEPDRVSALLKAAMVAGLVALVAGRIA